MAIQNFLAGGFHGKLGDVVGQRWRNKRTLRAHVIPFNPRTDLQQANRHQFALATALAQQAFNINKGWDIWQRPDMGQFSWMVGTAKRRLQAGATPAEALPLYPEDYDPTVVIRNATADYSEWSPVIKIFDTSYVLPATRRFRMVINCHDEIINQPIMYQEEFTLTKGEPFYLAIDHLNRYTFPQGSSVQGATVDDDQHAGASITLPVLLLEQPSKANFTLEIENWKYDTTDIPEMLYFYTDFPFPHIFDDIPVSIRAYRTTSPAWVNLHSEMVAEGEPVMQASFYCEGHTFPLGSRVNASVHIIKTHPRYQVEVNIYDWDFNF
jgi:hypothetical protein